MAKIEVTVFLPGLLANCTEGRREVAVEGVSLEQCIESLVTTYPLLAVHLFDEARQLRPHVNVFHNETNVKWLEDWRIPVREGDTLTILQAVSGG